MAKWQTLSSEEVYKTPWIRVRRDEVLTHNKKRLTYSVVESVSPSVFIVATNTRGEILMQQGYKYPVDKVIWEIPAGHADDDDLLAAAKRELLEETGYVAEEWKELGGTYPAIGIGNLPLTVFWAKNVHKSSDKLDEDEAIESHTFMSLSEIESMIRKDGFEDGSVLAALYIAKIHGLK